MNKNAQLIMDIVQASKEHPTAEKIYFLAKQISPKIVMATVYNNLNRLVEEKKLRRLKILGHTDRYDKATRHDHMSCVVCGKIVDVNLEDMSEKLRSATGENIITYDLNISYICSDCKSK